MTPGSSNPILPTPLQTLIGSAIRSAGGWIGFDDFMARALYAPGLGYYSRNRQKLGLMPAGAPGMPGSSGSDFATAPEMSRHFGRALARQLAQALQATDTREVWEFGAGSGALALHLLQALGDGVERYSIVDLSGSLRAEQQQTLAAFGSRVRWVDALPDEMNGVVVGNEVLDAMPVKLLARVNGHWLERGVAVHDHAFAFADRPGGLRPPLDIAGSHDYLTEIHPQAEAFVRTLADRLQQGAIFLIDYGFPEAEYYHPQRSMGTLMCHRNHQLDTDALADVGDKDITAHINFTGIALAGQDAGLQVLGYTGQGRFLLNCGITDGLDQAGIGERAMAQKLVNEHEMGELFKVIGFAPNKPQNPYSGWQAVGFASGDRTHRL